MMGFFDTLGNMFGDITGANQANQGAEQNKAGMAAANAGANTLASAAGNAGGIAGVNPTQFAQQAGQAGQALGEQMGRQAATSGTQAATQAARTAGLNKGQAALAGGQQAGQLYSQGQNAGQMAGMGAYGQGANTQLGGVNAQTMAGGQQGSLGTNLLGSASKNQEAGNQATGGLLNAVGGLFSDEKVKKDEKKSPDIEAILRKIKPESFKYKEEMKQGDGEHVGVMAQDMEKTPLKENVVDTPAGKMINPAKQENSNLNLIVQLGSRIKELEEQLKGGK